MILLNVPTINDEPSDFDRLFHPWQQIEEKGILFEEVRFDFSNCRFLRQNAVAFLGGLAHYIEHNAGTLTFAWETLRADVRQNLAQNGFMAAFGRPMRPWVGNSIPYRRDSVLDRDGVTEYLRDKWLGRGWIQVAPSLRDAIAGSVWEVYANAFEHGHSPIGVVSCGQRYPDLGRLKLTVIDFGVGIPYNVQRFKGNPRIAPERALEWAFQRGTSTAPGSRGLGLALLQEFVEQNHGRLEIYSQHAYAVLTRESAQFLARSTNFGGTIVNISISCDESVYHPLTNEVDEPYF